MDARELRIGNWYRFDGPTPNQFDRITAQDIVNLESDPLDDSYQRIPLTEEWLVRFGFEIYANSSVVNGWCIGKNPITRDYLFDLKWMKNEDGSLAECFYKNGYFVMKFVHQLQNLYFALTGKELETT